MAAAPATPPAAKPNVVVAFMASLPSSDFDINHLWLHRWRFRQHNGQHAILELGPNLVGVYFGRQREASNEAAVLPLDLVEAFPLLFLFLLPLSFERQNAVLDVHLDLFFLDIA